MMFVSDLFEALNYLYLPLLRPMLWLSIGVLCLYLFEKALSYFEDKQEADRWEVIAQQEEQEEVYYSWKYWFSTRRHLSKKQKYLLMHRGL